MSKSSPAGVTIDNKRREVIIKWTDDHSSSYTFGYLRANCPCAGCRQQREQEGKDSLHLIEDDNLELEGAEAIGGYAIRFRWSDGHSAGIYSWELLKTLQS